ncbi:unnamed protein product, partial [Symbiodinium necroappetens]
MHVDIHEAELELVKRSILSGRKWRSAVVDVVDPSFTDLCANVADGFSLDFDYVGKDFLPSHATFAQSQLVMAGSAVSWLTASK